MKRIQQTIVLAEKRNAVAFSFLDLYCETKTLLQTETIVT